MSFLSKLFHWRCHPTKGGDKYASAVRVSDDLLASMRKIEPSDETIRDILTNIWKNKHNMPYLTTVYETVAEMDVGAKRQPPSKR